ncbi:magnesium-chelatase 60 kDa subunit [Jannaschia pagri]|uniref:Magnesium-chelatase 60 kDa subunit n=1 Tax=Jannaschia pagri TaxID=2829797 RepID=A0ABQ4NLB4_9RHOB|nr:MULTISPECIES: magnesium chelatase subunit D [unclassified Jannaschia]GIT91367.1 magnesium-chelatase 60 kDa subunit [Jannaschia sp. AI_61]GIT95201.1 magnesium-chelatase 60 kDa subunit [Jannaschia sp. AI_62]
MSAERWAQAVRTARCLALDPTGLGGLHLRARAGDARTAFLALLTDRLPAAARLHPDMGDDALFGGLDLAETLAHGRPVQRAGLIDRHKLLVLPMAERTTPGLAARLGQVLDGGDRSLIALDEGAEPDERLPPALVDRMGLFLDLDGLRAADLPDLSPLPDGPALSSNDLRGQVVALTLALGIASQRRGMFTLRLAQTSASIDGRAEVSEADLAFAIQVALLPHATQMPPAPPEEAAETPDDAPPPDEQDGPPKDQPLPDGDILLEAALASLPPDLLSQLAQGAVPRATGTGAGATRKGNRRGRPLPPRAGRLDGRARLDLVATLRAAAPWQRLRGGGPGQPVQVRASDIRLKRYETRSDRLLIFAVDASGSAAFARLAEVKGAVELLLAEAYARRDHVALIAFRGTAADLLLPPTRSLLRTKKELSGLPGGGGTPLAAGLRQSAELAHQARGRGMDPAVIVLTDGRPNITLAGEAARGTATAEATTMARTLRAAQVPGLLIDAGNRPTPALATLAAEMGAPCVPLPRADAEKMRRTVAQALA